MFFPDFEIARKALEKSADITQQQQLQDTYDASAQKLENQKDNTITDIFTLASKEQEIAKVKLAHPFENLSMISELRSPPGRGTRIPSNRYAHHRDDSPRCQKGHR